MFSYQLTVSHSQPFQIVPYRQVNQVLIACGVNSWYKKVMVVVEVVNLCVLDYVVPVFPLAPCLEVEDKLEYQSLNQIRSGLEERTFNSQTTSMGGSASNLPFRDFGRGQSDLFPNITCMPCITSRISILGLLALLQKKMTSRMLWSNLVRSPSSARQPPRLHVQAYTTPA